MAVNMAVNMAAPFDHFITFESALFAQAWEMNVEISVEVSFDKVYTGSISTVLAGDNGLLCLRGPVETFTAQGVQVGVSEQGRTIPKNTISHMWISQDRYDWLTFVYSHIFDTLPSSVLHRLILGSTV